MSAEEVVAPTRHVEDLADCYFYHVMNLPGHGVVGSEWDLRGREDDYLGGLSFQGRRVLELGTASGFLCHTMEAQGADVIGFDLSPEQSWDLVPFAGLDMRAFRARMKAHIEKLNNGWWFAHRVFESKARVVYGNIYDIPDAIGPVDIATFGAILLHLRSPFDALHSALRLTSETVVVTEVHPEQPADSPLGTVAKSHGHPGTLYFLPDCHATDPNAAVTWWCLPPRVICQFLGVLGFERTTVTEHVQIFRGQPARMYTVVGTRTKGFIPR